jgi:hypothetical protein
MLDRLERYGRQLIPTSDPGDAGWQRRHDTARTAARRVHGRDQHALLRDLVNTATGDPHAVPPLPRVDHVGLAHVTARLLAGGGEDVGEDELLQAMSRAWPEQAAPLAAAATARWSGPAAPDREWQDFPLAAGWAALPDAVRAAPDAALCEAAELVTVTGAIQETILVRLGPASLDGLPPPPGVPGRVAPEAMATVLNDPGWAWWGRHLPLDGGSPAWPTVAAYQIALTLLLPGQATAVTDYRARLQNLIQPASVI